MVASLGTCPIDVASMLKERQGRTRGTIIGLWSYKRTEATREVVHRIANSLAEQTQSQSVLVRIDEDFSKTKSLSKRKVWFPNGLLSKGKRATAPGEPSLTMVVYDPDGTEVASESIAELSMLPFLKRQFRVVLVDLCESQPTVSESVGRLCNSVFVMVEPSRYPVHVTRISIDRLKQAGVKLGGFWTISTSCTSNSA